MKCALWFLFAWQVNATSNLRAQVASHMHRVLAKSLIVDFSGYKAGDVITQLENGITVTSMKRINSKSGPLEAATAMIFDSQNPTGGDADLGAPNVDFGGPGIGRAGKKGSEVANTENQGKILIISTDNDASDPNDHRYGGYILFEFSQPMFIEDIGLLDNEEKTKFEIVTLEGKTIEIEAGRGGDNSFETISLADHGGAVLATQMKITFGGSGAITHLKLNPETPQTQPTASPTPSPTNSNAVCEIVSFVLWDASKNAPLYPIEDEHTYCIQEWPEQVSIEVLTADCVDYVKIQLEGALKMSRVEGAYPYMLAGDRRGDVHPVEGLVEGDYECWAFPDGNRKLRESVSFSLQDCPNIS